MTGKKLDEVLIMTEPAVLHHRSLTEWKLANDFQFRHRTDDLPLVKSVRIEVQGDDHKTVARLTEEGRWAMRGRRFNAIRRRVERGLEAKK